MKKQNTVAPASAAEPMFPWAGFEHWHTSLIDSNPMRHFEYAGWYFSILSQPSFCYDEGGPRESVAIVNGKYFLASVIAPVEGEYVDAAEKWAGRLVYQVQKTDGSLEDVERWRLPHYLYGTLVAQWGGWETFAEIHDGVGHGILQSAGLTKE